MFIQNLPTYIHTFENDPRWKTSRSEHYVFHYFPDSVAEKDLVYIRERQKQAFIKILNFLQVAPPDRSIEYFLYPDKKTKRELMGDDWYAQSIYNEFRIHALYTEKDKSIGEHEDTHLLSLPWGLSIGFFQEGLADFMVGCAWDGTAHAQYVKEGYQHGFFPSLERFLAHSTWVEKSEMNTIHFYSIAGAFVSYLVREFGKERFELLYRGTARAHSLNQNVAIFSTIYGVPMGNMEFKFKQALSIS